MRKHRRLNDPAREIAGVGARLYDAAEDFDNAMMALHGVAAQAKAAARGRLERQQALEREADAFNENDTLRRFFVDAVVDVRNSHDLSMEDRVGAVEALKIAHEAIETARKEREVLDEAINAAEKRVAELEFQLEGYDASTGQEMDLDEIMPDTVAGRVRKAFGLPAETVATVGDAIAAITDRVTRDTVSRTVEWIGFLLKEEKSAD